MRSIQDLRERREHLLNRARKLLDENPGPKWTPDRQEQFDQTLADINAVTRDIDSIQDELSDFAKRITVGGERGWVNAETGVRIPVAYASRGSLAAQLSAAGFGKATGEKISLAEFVRGVGGMKTSPAVHNALSVGTDASGGYAVPAEVQLGIIDALAPMSSLLGAGTGVAILESGAKQYRLAAMDTIPTAAWRAEAGALATSDPALRTVDLIPQSLAFQFKVSRELLQDAPNIEPALRTVIAQAFAKELDRAGLRGTGATPEIRGIKNIAGIQAVTNGANGASLATTAYQNLVDAAKAIRAANGPMPTAAIMSTRSLFVLAGLLDTTDQPRRRPPLLEPWKFIDTSQIPENLTVGTSNDCSEMYVADFSTTGFFFREQMSIQRLSELYAGTGEIGFACHVRADFGAMYPAALALVTGVRP